MQIKDPVDFLKKHHESIRIETRKKVGATYFTWTEWYSTLIDFMKGILKTSPKMEYSRSLLFNRLIEFNKLLLLLHELSVTGYYHSTIRELRYLLESALQSYYLDFNTEYSLEEKVEAAQNLYGIKKLVNKMELKEEVKTKIRQIYKTLSSYVHPSTDEILSSYKDISYRVTFAYNKELFSLCVSLTHGVLDLVSLLTLRGFSFLANELKQDKFLLKWLKANYCELTIEQLFNSKIS